MKRVSAVAAMLLLVPLLVRLLLAQAPTPPPSQAPPPPPTSTLTDLGSMHLTPARKRIQNLRLADAYGRLPLSFESNQGQTDPVVKFLSRGAGRTLFFTSTEAVLTSGKANAVHMKLLGANRNAQVVGLDKLPGNSNYFLGNDPAKWRTNVPTYARVRYRHIYPGVDLVYYGNQRELEYDFLVARGVDPAQIRLAIHGATRLWIDADGSAVLRCEAGDIRLLRPHLYQQIRGRKIKVNGSYVLKGHELRFAVGQYDHHEPLVIDPVLVYSTYLGGSGGDSPTGIAVDSSGNAYITGQTNSLNFPGAPGNGKFQNFVVKLNSAGNAVLYSTYISGTGTELAKAISVDGTGNAYIAGYTNSSDFPVRNALQATNHGGYDAFLAKLDANGNLIYSTYLGGSKDDQANAIAVDAAGNAYITGQTGSSDFPVTPTAAQPSLVGNFFNAFVAKVNANGSAVGYATYLGGSGQDSAQGIAVDSTGNAYVAGNTASFNFPVTGNALQRAFGGGSQDGFVTQVNPSGTAFDYSTYLGGSDNDFLNAIALDAGGNAYVTGRTASVDFPGVTANSLQPTNVGTYNAVVAKLNPAGTALLYSTYLGGFAVDTGNGIALDTSGNVYVAGTTRSTNFPVMNAIQPALGGGSDAFVSQLNSTGTALLFSTYLGGGGNDGGNGIALDSAGNVYITGDTASSDFPVTANPLQAAYGGNNDAFVAKLSAASAPPATNTTLSTSANPSVFGQQVSFMATVTPTQSSSLMPTGTVAFKDGSNVLGAMALTSGTAIFNAAALGVGTHNITASYGGDNNFGSSTSTGVSQTVNQAGTTTALAASPNPANLGQTVTFTATVTVIAPGAGTPTGTVTFLDGATTLGIGVLSPAGTATFSTSLLAVGSHTVTTSYGGDATFAGSTSTGVIVTVQGPPPVAQVMVSETVHVADVESFPDAFDSENIHIGDTVFVTPLIDVTAPVAEYSAGSLGFGNVVAGQTATQSLTVSDIGKAPLTVSSAMVSAGSAFTVTHVSCSNGARSLPTTLQAGGACNFLISYLAPVGAAANDTLTFTDNAALSNVASVPAGSSFTQSIALSGSGSTTPPPPPPPAVVSVMDNETIHVADTASFPEVFDREKISVLDQVTVIPCDFTITASSPMNVPVGGSGSTPITITSVNGCNLQVSLTASSSFLGATVSLPSTATTGGSSTSATLTVSAGPSVTPTSFTVAITGTAGLTHSASVSVNITASISGTIGVVQTLANAGAINNGGIANALTSKLSAAQSAGSPQTSINTLKAFQNQVQAQAGQHIATSFTLAGVTFNPASTLMSNGQALIDSFRVGMIPDPITGDVVNSSGLVVPGATVSIADATGTVVASATTDVTGFYFMATTGILIPGTNYNIRVSTLPSGFTNATPSSQSFTWQGVAVALNNFVLN